MGISASDVGRSESVAVERTALRRALAQLAQPMGGVFRPSVQVEPRSGEAKFSIRMVDVGKPSKGGGSLVRTSGQHRPRGITGVGTSLADDEALFLAHAEALERYATCVFHDEQFILATATELGREAMDLDTLPKCSTAELRHPNCRLVAPLKTVALKWVPAWSMLESRVVHVPASLVYLNVPLTPAERIALPITTGCAAYTSYAGALMRGLLEVIERDAISLVWLLRLSLPRIEIDVIPEELEGAWRQYERASPKLEYLFFDATTDVGVFTVYALQIAHDDARVHTLVSCATDINPAVAIAKAIRDLTHLRTALRHERPIPSNWDEFVDVLDGATFMAQQSQAAGFNFLKRAPSRCALSRLLRGPTCREEEALADVIGRFRGLGLDVYAVDLTTDEALRCGMRIVRAIVPGLQPLSFSYRTRYLAHSRLYSAPARMGQTTVTEPDINPLPQPFA